MAGLRVTRQGGDCIFRRLAGDVSPTAAYAVYDEDRTRRTSVSHTETHVCWNPRCPGVPEAGQAHRRHTSGLPGGAPGCVAPFPASNAPPTRWARRGRPSPEASATTRCCSDTVEPATDDSGTHPSPSLSPADGKLLSLLLTGAQTRQLPYTEGPLRHREAELLSGGRRSGGTASPPAPWWAGNAARHGRGRAPRRGDRSHAARSEPRAPRAPPRGTVPSRQRLGRRQLREPQRKPDLGCGESDGVVGLLHRLAHPADQLLEHIVTELPVAGSRLLPKDGIADLDDAQGIRFSSFGWLEEETHARSPACDMGHVVSMEIRILRHRSLDVPTHMRAQGALPDHGTEGSNERRVIALGENGSTTHGWRPSSAPGKSVPTAAVGRSSTQNRLRRIGGGYGRIVLSEESNCSKVDPI